MLTENKSDLLGEYLSLLTFAQARRTVRLIRELARDRANLYAEFDLHNVGAGCIEVSCMARNRHTGTVVNRRFTV